MFLQMRYFLLATDYDGTLAEEGLVPPPTVDALERVRQTGRHLILVTGRELPDLQATFPQYSLFERIVGENGAVLYDPSSKAETVLCEAPPRAFLDTLARKQVSSFSQGRVIVATSADEKEKVLEAIQELGLELQLIFNKGSLMILPTGVNKATGLKAALTELGFSAHNTVGVGDAENDHAFLSVCERAVSVANALPALKERSDFVTTAAAGQGVAELIDLLIQDDLKGIPAKEERDAILLGQTEQGDVRIPGYGTGVLVTGTPGAGKSTLTTGVMERLMDAGYQFCAIDPEGDYQTFEGAILMGEKKRGPTVDEALAILENPEQSLILNLLGIAVDDRPAFFESLLPRLQELRARTGRPHWLIFDEAHHLAPAERERTNDTLPKELTSTMLITVQPDHLPQSLLASIDTIITVGEKPSEAISSFCRAGGRECPTVRTEALEPGTALLWSRSSRQGPILFKVAQARTERVRHSRKYASAELTPDRSFYFRGREGKLNLRAQNLMVFVQLLEGVDDDTWLYHLQRGEYSQWLRDNIKDAELADAAARIEQQHDLSVAASRARIKEEIEQRFTLPG
jgi:HAD superfamily hydrolase (TIGR01484 family)